MILLVLLILLILFDTLDDTLDYIYNNIKNTKGIKETPLWVVPDYNHSKSIKGIIIFPVNNARVSRVSMVSMVSRVSFLTN